MPLVRPFAALRPAPGRAADVIAPPYDVVTTDEARQLAVDRPWSFLHISRAEIDLPVGTDPMSSEVYAKAAENLRRMKDQGVLLQDSDAYYYVYRLAMGDWIQTGLVAAASVVAYDQGRIRRHEFTRPDKEDDRVRQIEALGAQTGPALLAYPEAPEVDRLLAQIATGTPDADVTAETGVRHTLWVVRDDGLAHRLTQLFDAMPALYIADGHHRSAAASRVASARRAGKPNQVGGEPYEYFLSVLFPGHEMHILDYNRVIKDLNELAPEKFWREVTRKFDVDQVAGPYAPERQGQFGLYLGGCWYKLAIRAEWIPDDPVGRLDVSLLHDHLISPILGIHDARRDKRIDFVGGIRGLPELKRRVDSGEMTLAFALFPTRIQELMAVADAGEVMPPKSTWFEPKLADGLASHVID